MCIGLMPVSHFSAGSTADPRLPWASTELRGCGRHSAAGSPAGRLGRLAAPGGRFGTDAPAAKGSDVSAAGGGGGGSSRGRRGAVRVLEANMLWMAAKSILHHLETMVEAMVRWHLQGIHNCWVSWVVQDFVHLVFEGAGTHHWRSASHKWRSAAASHKWNTKQQSNS